MIPLRLRLFLISLVSTSCAVDDSGTTVADTGAATESRGTESDGGTDPGTQTGPSSTDSSATDPSTTGPDDTGSSSGADTSASSTDADDTETGTTGAGPTSGPGVLPGEGGLEAFCRRYVECGGTYYADQQACIDASYDYWGACESRADALDVFGACMADIECTDWSPDAYNPASTPCAEQWQGVAASDPC
jgi:hypothetical protein